MAFKRSNLKTVEPETYDDEENQPGTFRSVMSMHQTAGELAVEPSMIPEGTWLLRAISLSHKEVDVEQDGATVKSDQFTLIEEPFEPTKSVDPEEVAEVNESGEPVYAGRRLFSTYKTVYPQARRDLALAMVAYGLGEKTMAQVVNDKLIRGRKAFGEVYTNSYKTRDGNQRSDSKVRTRAPLADDDE